MSCGMSSSRRFRFESESRVESRGRFRSLALASCQRETDEVSREVQWAGTRGTTNLGGPRYPVPEVEPLPLFKKLKSKRGGSQARGSRREEKARTAVASREILGSSCIAAQRVTGSSILDDSTLFRAMSGQAVRISRTCGVERVSTSHDGR